MKKKSQAPHCIRIQTSPTYKNLIITLFPLSFHLGTSKAWAFQHKTTRSWRPRRQNYHFKPKHIKDQSIDSKLEERRGITVLRRRSAAMEKPKAVRLRAITTMWTRVELLPSSIPIKILLLLQSVQCIEKAQRENKKGWKSEERGSVCERQTGRHGASFFCLFGSGTCFLNPLLLICPWDSFELRGSATTQS